MIDYDLQVKMDIRKIKMFFLDEGVELTDLQISKIWSNYSDELCASWLGLPEDMQRLKVIFNDYKIIDDVIYKKI